MTGVILHILACTWEFQTLWYKEEVFFYIQLIYFKLNLFKCVICYGSRKKKLLMPVNYVYGWHSRMLFLAGLLYYLAKKIVLLVNKFKGEKKGQITFSAILRLKKEEKKFWYDQPQYSMGGGEVLASR